MSGWYRLLAPKPSAEMRLFIFHHAGGSANAYFRWAGKAPDQFEVVLCELPGRGVRVSDAMISDFQEAVGSLARETPQWLDRPAVFFGHSLGGLLSFELARRLVREGRGAEIRGLGLSSILPPTSENLAKREMISHLPDQEFIERISVYSPMPEQILRDPQILAFFLPVVRNDIRMMESFALDDKAPLRLPLMVFAGASDPTSTPAQLSEWRKFGDLVGEVQTLAGAHFHLFGHAEQILASLHRQFA